MSVTDVGGLIVSFVALSIAVYGIFERQRAAYAGVRVRITEILDEVEDLNVEEDKYVESEYAKDKDGNGEPPPTLARSSITGRRALLTYQALALTRRLTHVRLGRSDDLHLTPSEHISLAYSLVRLGDVAGAQDQYEAALASTEETTDRVRIAAHLGLANCLFGLGETADGRMHFQEAISLHSTDAIGQQMAFDVCLDQWLARELEAGSEGEPATAVRAGRAILRRAVEVPQPSAWALEGQVALRHRATRTICVDGAYAEEIVGYDDDAPPVPPRPLARPRRPRRERARAAGRR